MTPSRTLEPDTALDGTPPGWPSMAASAARRLQPVMTVNVARPTRRRAASKAPRTEPDATATESGVAEAMAAVLAAEASTAVPSWVPTPAPAPPPAWAPTPAPTPPYVPRMLPGESMTIGEIDQTLFDCPSCARPLALGARRCPGCGIRLISGVVAAKVAVFVAAGLAIGLLAGSVAGFALGAAQGGAPALAALPSPLASGAAGRPPPASTGPSATTTAAASPTPTAGTVSAMPPAAIAALVQTIGTNDELARAGAELRAALAARTFDASDVARILRSVSADSVQGEQLASKVGSWTGSVAVATQLSGFYGSIHDTAAEGLLASVRNARAYRSAATTMVRLLADIPAIDAAIRAAGTDAGVTIPAMGSIAP